MAKLQKTVPAKSFVLDPIPTWLLKQVTISIAPVICHLCNLSLQFGTSPTFLKQVRLLPLLKKPTLDPDIACSYWPISGCFNTHISNSHLLLVQQSAYLPFHSTETAVLSVHNDLVCAIENGQVSLPVLLDLSAAFDTVDHSILLSVSSSRFSVVNTAFSWFQSYLSGRSQSYV